MTATQTFEIETLNRADGSVDGHKAGCRDIARIAKAERLDRSGSWAVASKHQAWEDYNADFIAECEEGDECDHEAHTYHINWLPCTDHVPATADDTTSTTTTKESTMTKQTATKTEAELKAELAATRPVVRTYDTSDAKLLKSALGVTCPIPYCAATPDVPCHSAGGKEVQPHTKRVQKANKPAKPATAKAPADRKTKQTRKDSKAEDFVAAKEAATKKAEPKPEPELLPVCKPCLTRHHKSCKGTVEAPCGCESKVHA